MAKEESMKDNSFGVVSVVFGIFSVLIGSLGSVVLGLIGLLFGIKQRRIHRNKWSKWGINLSLIGIVVGIISTILIAKYGADFISQFQQMQGG